VTAATTRARRFAQALASTRRTDGLPAAIRLGAALAAEIALRPVTRRQDRRLDRRLGIDTGRDPHQVDLAPATAHGDGVAYSPTPTGPLRRILRALPVGDPAGFTFVDLGCGKGRALLLAAEHGYGRVIGVELDAGLADTARRNIKAYENASPGRAGVVEVVAVDAAAFVPPAGPTVVFLFNPFGEDTLRAVVDRIERSAARPVFVAYFNPMHRDALAGFRRVAGTARWEIYAR
jgi:SAM-dependent methyltransferase